MNVYRIVRKKRVAEDLKGIGASINPGRWNKENIPCVYSAESRALAMVEYLANITREVFLHSKFILRILSIPDKCIEKFPINKLPDNWKDKPPPIETREFGANLLLSKKALAYRLPSVIIPGEFNIIIDPNHADIKKLVVLGDRIYTLTNGC